MSISKLLVLGTVVYAAGSTLESQRAVAAEQVSNGADASGSRGVEEVVVTAQRREQRSQDVPISVTALTADSMQAMGISGTNDLAMSVPGLELGRQNIAIAPFIRGIGNKSTAPGEEAAVALYIDGVYMPTLTAGLFELENVERVEVLKGPQGTLFGRNATAGVIQVITRDPQEKFSADMHAGYANYDTFNAGLYATTSIAPRVRTDISLYGSEQSEGWGKNLNTGNDVFLGYEYSARSKWIVDLSESTELKLSFDYGKAKPNTPPAYHPLPGRILTSGVPSFAGSTPYFDFYDVSETRDVYATTRQWGSNAQLRHSFDAFDFVSITSYRDAETHWFFDQDGGPAPVVTPTSTETAQTWTQELQLLSQKGRALEWIVGAYYFHNDAAYDPLQLAGTALPFVIDRYTDMKAESYAGFAQGTANVAAATKLTLGVRYTHDTRDIDGFDLRNGVLAPTTVRSQTASFDKLTWRASLDHRFSDEFMAYIADTRGFKSGVFSAVAYTDPPAKPETLDTYELGFKSDLLDRRVRLNGAIFYNDFKDVQVQSQVVGGIKLNNAAKARTYGIDLDAETRLDNLTVRLAMTYLNGEYKAFPGASFYTRNDVRTVAQGTGDATGRDTIHTPPFTLSLSGNYKIPATIGEFILAASYSYNDGYFFDPQNAVSQSSYQLLNASVAYATPSGRWGARVWAKNLTDES